MGMGPPPTQHGFCCILFFYCSRAHMQCTRFPASYALRTLISGSGRFPVQEAVFEGERTSHAVPEWSKYLAEPSEHPQPSHPNVPLPRGSPTAAYFSL